MSHKTVGYASDLTDVQWAVIKALLPRCKRGRPLEIDMRLALKGMFYIVRTGSQWDQ